MSHKRPSYPRRPDQIQTATCSGTVACARPRKMLQVVALTLVARSPTWRWPDVEAARMRRFSKVATSGMFCCDAGVPAMRYASRSPKCSMLTQRKRLPSSTSEKAQYSSVGLRGLRGACWHRLSDRWRRGCQALVLSLAVLTCHQIDAFRKRDLTVLSSLNRRIAAGSLGVVIITSMSASAGLLPDRVERAAQERIAAGCGAQKVDLSRGDFVNVM